MSAIKQGVAAGMPGAVTTFTVQRVAGAETGVVSSIFRYWRSLNQSLTMSRERVTMSLLSSSLP